MFGTTCSVEVTSTSALTDKQWDDLWMFSRRFFETSRTCWREDVASMSDIAIVRSMPDGEVVGTAAIDMFLSVHRERTLQVIYTGSVILENAYRGRNILQKIGARCYFQRRREHPTTPIYWLFNSFGYKSYLVLARNMVEYWPNPDQATPEWDETLMDALSERLWGESWDRQRGIVVRNPEKRLKTKVNAIDPVSTTDPAIDFYLAKNPGYLEGDMLVCMAPLHAKNWASIIQNALKRGLRLVGRQLRRAS